MPRTAKHKPNTRRGRPRLETQRALYQIKLSGWDFTWSFSLALPNGSRANEGHYHEHMILALKGEVLYPESFKYPEVECQWQLKLYRFLAADDYKVMVTDPVAKSERVYKWSALGGGAVLLIAAISIGVFAFANSTKVELGKTPVNVPEPRTIPAPTLLPALAPSPAPEPKADELNSPELMLPETYWVRL